MNNSELTWWDKTDIESNFRDSIKLWQFIEINQENEILIYLLESLVLLLREISYLMEKKFSNQIDDALREKIMFIKDVRDAICHRTSPKNFYDNHNKIKLARSLKYGKGSLAQIDDYIFESEYDNDIAVFYGRTRIYVVRDIKYTLDAFFKIYKSVN